jgi:hypothetical protein
MNRVTLGLAVHEMAAVMSPSRDESRGVMAPVYHFTGASVPGTDTSKRDPKPIY